MKTSIYTIVALLAVTSAAFAGINTTKPMGPLDLVITAAGNGIITNAGSAPFAFDGYTISSAGGLIVGDPVGILDNCLLDMVYFPPTVGLDMAVALAWNELAKTANNYSEATLGAVATLQPGGIINLGPSFPGGNQADLTFTYTDSTSTTDVTSWEGDVVPEPATMSLLGLGALTLTRRRR